jgi:hypothetical protein
MGSIALIVLLATAIVVPIVYALNTSRSVTTTTTESTTVTTATTTTTTTVTTSSTTSTTSTTTTSESLKVLDNVEKGDWIMISSGITEDSVTP